MLDLYLSRTTPGSLQRILQEVRQEIDLALQREQERTAAAEARATADLHLLQGQVTKLQEDLGAAGERCELLGAQIDSLNADNERLEQELAAVLKRAEEAERQALLGRAELPQSDLAAGAAPIPVSAGSPTPRIDYWILRLAELGGLVQLALLQSREDALRALSLEHAQTEAAERETAAARAEAQQALLRAEVTLGEERDRRRWAEGALQTLWAWTRAAWGLCWLLRQQRDNARDAAESGFQQATLRGERRLEEAAARAEARLQDVQAAAAQRLAAVRADLSAAEALLDEAAAVIARFVLVQHLLPACRPAARAQLLSVLAGLRDQMIEKGVLHLFGEAWEELRILGATNQVLGREIERTLRPIKAFRSGLLQVRILGAGKGLEWQYDDGPVYRLEGAALRERVRAYVQIPRKPRLQPRRFPCVPCGVQAGAVHTCCGCDREHHLHGAARCGRRADGDREVLKLFGIRENRGRLLPQTMCKECRNQDRNERIRAESGRGEERAFRLLPAREP